MPPELAAQSAFDALNQRVIACERCPRLRAYCAEIARKRRRAYRDETYWGRPVPGFGDPEAASSFSGLRPAPMARTAPVAPSPAMAPAIFSIRCSTKPDSPPSLRRAAAMTA